MAEEKRACSNVGGQAVLEDVMMRSGENCSVAVRLEDGTIKTVNSKFKSIRQKHKFLDVPIIRGIVNFVEMLKLSYTTLSVSADAMLTEEEKEKENKKKKEGKSNSTTTFVMIIAMVFGIALSVALFIWLPTFITGLIPGLNNENLAYWSWERIAKALIEGVLKIAIFVGYLLAVSLMKDIRRTFEYHGAEHKSIFCYEKGLELTVENVKKQSRLHPRCGTSFMFVMIFMSIIVGIFMPLNPIWLRTACKLLLLPLIVGVGYEILMFSAKKDNFFVRAMVKPGIWMQKITTREPDASQIEVAIAALKGALPLEFPEEVPENEETLPEDPQI